MHLRCVLEKEAEQIMRDVHSGVCGPHMNGKELARKIMRQGYYQLTMEHNCIQFVRSCHKSQMLKNIYHIPPSMLQTLTSPRPFLVWGIDIMGKIAPLASNGHEFIVMAVDYFSKWVEAQSFKKLGAKQMTRFIEKNLICRYGVPHHIVTDNGVQFQAKVRDLLQRYGIEHHKSAPYRYQANGTIEAANKSIK